MNNSRAAAEQRLHAELVRTWQRSTATAILLGEQGLNLDPVAQIMLQQIAAEGSLRASDLSDRMGLSRPAMSRRVAALEKSGLVETSPDPDDGRASRVSVTEAGIERLAAVSRSGAATVSEMVADFDTHELDAFTTLLGRINDRAAMHRAAHSTKGIHDHHND